MNEIINNYYNNYDEDSRLIKDKAHSIEYITTTNYIEKYLKEGDRILEVGAGTGRYSINYAKKGYRVDSVELVNKNLEILKSKIAKDMKINAVQGNAMNLDMYEDDTFDVTLVLGPLYHLYNENDAKKAISEAIRVTKKSGKIIIAYITDDAVILSYGVQKGNLKKLKELCDENWNMPKLEEEIFATYKVEEFDKIISCFEVNKLETIAADGISLKLRDYINNFTEEEFDIYVNYHLTTCNRKDLIGHSSHVLEIIEKK